MLAPTLVYFGRWEEGLELINIAKELNPFPGQWHHWYRGFALFSARDFAGAVAALKGMRPIHYRAHAYLAASYGHLGQIEEARSELSLFTEGRKARLLSYGASPEEPVSDLLSEWVQRYRRTADRDHFLEGLHKAGLPA